MQIVINIPDEKYDRLVYQDIISLRSYIENGIVIPKGHGRLIDADALNFNADYNEPLISKLDFDNAPTIIEKDEVEK